MNRIGKVTITVFALSTVTAAQGGDPREEMKQRMEEISRLMRDSERGLLDISRMGRLLEEQTQIVQKLKELEPPTTEGGAPPPEATEEERKKLRQQQEEVERRIRQLFEGQKATSALTVKQLEELLKSLPVSQGKGEGDPEKDSKGGEKQKDEEKQLQDREEKKQDKPNQPKDGEEKKQQDKEQKPGGKKPESESEQAAKERRINAWIARLPPEIQERLNRNDYSAIPARYQRLVREITALRAKREAEDTAGR